MSKKEREVMTGKIDSNLITQAAKLVAAHAGGLTVEDVAIHLGVGVDRARAALKQAAETGQIKRLFVHMQPARWMSLSEHALAVDRRREHERVYAANLYRSRREAGVIDSYNRLKEPPDWPVERRIVPALGLPPVATRAARSVFDLGAML